MILSSLRFIIGVVRVEKFLGVIYFLISGIEEIFVRYRCYDEVLGSGVLNILFDVLHLKVHLL